MYETQFLARPFRFMLQISVCCSLSLPALAQVIYVDADAPPGGTSQNGDWSDPYTQLRDALVDPRSSSHEIWVAEGIYKPTATTDRTQTFSIPAYGKIYGGFRGDEALRADRAGLFSTTILSGDIDGTPGLSNLDSFHVVTAATVGSLEFDGFTVQNGNANQTTLGNGFGGGMYINGLFSGGGVSFSQFRNCTFVNNRALYGGGLYAERALLPIANCNFINNSAYFEGGGAWFKTRQYDNFAHNVTFSRNSAQRGGGLYIVNTPTYTEFANCKFVGNLATGKVAGIVVGGAGAWIENVGYEELLFTHCTVAFNHIVAPDSTPGEGAGLYLGTAPNTVPKIFMHNSIVWNNLRYSGSAASGSNVEGPGSAPNEFIVSYSDIWQSSGLPWAGTGNIHAYPNWSDPISYDLTLLLGSPCLNTGNNSLIRTDVLDLDRDGDFSEGIPIELRRGRPRIGAYLSQPGTPPPPSITDMGCYEDGTVFGTN